MDFIRFPTHTRLMTDIRSVTVPPEPHSLKIYLMHIYYLLRIVSRALSL